MATAGVLIIHSYFLRFEAMAPVRKSAQEGIGNVDAAPVQYDSGGVKMMLVGRAEKGRRRIPQSL